MLRRDELDNASKDRAGKRFAEGFALALDFEPADDGDAPPANGGVLAWIADGHRELWRSPRGECVSQGSPNKAAAAGGAAPVGALKLTSTTVAVLPECGYYVVCTKSSLGETYAVCLCSMGFRASCKN